MNAVDRLSDLRASGALTSIPRNALEVMYAMAEELDVLRSRLAAAEARPGVEPGRVAIGTCAECSHWVAPSVAGHFGTCHAGDFFYEVANTTHLLTRATFGCIYFSEPTPKEPHG